MKYVLIGIPNAGKTTLGSLAAEKLGLSFYDTDQLTVDRINPQNKFDFVRPSFIQRMIDEQLPILSALSLKDENAIIAVGAIAPVDAHCADILPHIGTVIHIKRSVDSARADAIKKGGFTMVKVGDDGNPIEGSKINMSEEAVNEYATDLPVLDRIAAYSIDNDGDIDSGVKKLVALIQSIKETPSEETSFDA